MSDRNLMDRNQQMESGLNLAELRFNLMHKITWNYDDWLLASNFFEQYKIWAGSDKEKIVDVRAEIDDPETDFEIGDIPSNLSDEDKRKWIRSERIKARLKARRVITAQMLPDEIERVLSHPYVTAYYKAIFDYAYNQKLKGLDPISLGYVYSYSPKRASYENYEELSDLYWVKAFTGGNSAVVYGKKGSAKTGFTLLMASKHNAYYSLSTQYKGARFETNVEILEEEYRDTLFETFGEMLVKVFDNMSKGIKTLLIPDELTMNNIRKKKTMKGGTLSLDQFDKGTRKFDVDVCYVWHDLAEVPTEVFNSLSLVVHKLGGTEPSEVRKRGMAEVDFRNVRNGYKLVAGIPRPPIKYESKAIAVFVQDIEWDKVMEEYVSLRKESEEFYDVQKIGAQMRDSVAQMVRDMHDVEVEEPPEQVLEVKKGYTAVEMQTRYNLSKSRFSELLLYGDGAIEEVGEYHRRPTYRMNPVYEEKYFRKYRKIDDDLPEEEGEDE
ncbi:MAG: hypothetical protein ACYDAO_02585 [Thermoplasmataceae archaeon]